MLNYAPPHLLRVRANAIEGCGASGRKEHRLGQDFDLGKATAIQSEDVPVHLRSGHALVANKNFALFGALKPSAD